VPSSGSDKGISVKWLRSGWPFAAERAPRWSAKLVRNAHPHASHLELDAALFIALDRGGRLRRDLDEAERLCSPLPPRPTAPVRPSSPSDANFQRHHVSVAG
jgi:hypothetical protein